MYTYAIEEDAIDAVTLLIKHGADIDVADSNGNTPLHATAYSHNMSMIAELLIEHGANVNAINKRGETPLEVARKPEVYNMFPDESIIELLIQHGAHE